MKRPPKNPHLKTLEQALSERYGWQAQLFRDALAAIAARKAERLGLDEISYCKMAAASPGELQAVAEEVAPADTRFFRIAAHAEALRERVLPDLIAARAQTRRLRMWSVACATGEEAYSLAMLLRDALPPDEEWRAEIFASDMRGAAIMTASRGRYHAAQLRSLDPQVRNRYFIGLDEPGPDREFEIIPRVRRMVTLRRANVYEPHVWRQLPGPFDLIQCEHLLVYFHRLAVEEMVGRMADALGEGAYLVVGPSETGLVSHPAVRPDATLASGFFRKVVSGQSSDPGTAPPARRD